jgi:uncharacterized protein (TIGR03086 family)
VTTSPVEQLTQALDAFGELLAGVGDGQWSAPTPCTDWTVHDLVNHMVGGNRLFAEILRGDPDALSRRQGGLGRDHLGVDPVTAYRDAAEDLLEAFRQPGVMDRLVTVPVGKVPGAGALHLRLVECFVHGWDLARATGQPVEFSADVVEQALTFTRRKLADLPPERAVFAPSQPVADDAPAIDRLAACLGRPVATDSTGTGGSG